MHPRHGRLRGGCSLFFCGGWRYVQEFLQQNLYLMPLFTDVYRLPKLVTLLLLLLLPSSVPLPQPLAQRLPALLLPALLLPVVTVPAKYRRAKGRANSFDF